MAVLRLRKLRLRNGFTQREVADRLGVSQNTYSGWENGRSRIDSNTLIELAKLFDVTVDYLLGRPQKKPERGGKVKSIPVYGDVGLDKSRPILELIGFEPISRKLSRAGDCFGLRVTDDSMAPRVLAGDILIVRIQHKCKSGDMLVLGIDNSYITVKNIFKTRQGIILTESKHNSVPEFYSRDDIISKKIRVIGKVIEIHGKI